MGINDKIGTDREKKVEQKIYEEVLEQNHISNSTPIEIAETFADHYANISRDQNKERKTGKHRKRKKNYHKMNHSQKEN